MTQDRPAGAGTVPLPTPVAPRHPDWLGRSAIAVGVVALVGAVVGGGLYGSARADFGTLQRACQLRPCGPSDWASIDSRAAGAYATWGIAGVAAAAGATILFVRGARPQHATAYVAPAASGLVVGGRF